MNLSVAVSADWGIGFENELLFRISEDLRHFRTLTLGKVIVMGHNTLKSLPGGKPLPGRTNIVLSRQEGLKIPDAIVCNSLTALDENLQNYSPENIFIIGGEEIYAQLLNRCRYAYITKVDACPPADAFFPNIDEMEDWRLAEESSEKFSNGISYKFCKYKHAKRALDTVDVLRGATLRLEAGYGFPG
ncbi:MAG: dihydrofolate reductase [Defluviitaleaceae bacterium]|nr:dihydrofolate reductase [Defluviitaleaceae bacterium]